MEKKLNKLLAKSNKTIRQHTDELLQQANLLEKLGIIGSRELYKDLLAACEYHDYGKANLKFQERILYNSRFQVGKEVPHSILSLFYIDKGKCVNYTDVCFSVLFHHFRYSNMLIDTFGEDSDLIRNTIKKMPGKPASYEEISDCIDNVQNIFLLSILDERKKYAVLLKGFLHKCDYSASAGIDCEKENNFLNACIDKWEKDEYSKNSEFKIYDLQKYCRENTDSDIIVTAPTGMGKTEAGLMWCGNNKCFFVLPLKTSINAMYDRIQELAGDSYKEKVALIHSDMKWEYMQKASSDGEFDFEYFTKSRQMSLPISICTPDQIFDFVLKFAGYEYKLATASYSKFIIDEIQMYSADLLAAIMYAIKVIHDYGGKFAILTATLPPFVRQELKKIFGENVKIKDFSAESKTRHNVKVFEKKLEGEDIINTIDSVRSEKNKKFLVICNSIDIADKIYCDLSVHYEGDIEVKLLHAGFIKKDRKEKEKAILEAYEDRSKTEIWVSTSVVEASLNIDFDILFTELLDVFSLFQRFGRVNRRAIKDYSKTNCFVFTELQGNAKRYSFVDDTVYKLSKEAVMTIDGTITEEEKTRLIDEYLSVENLKNSKYCVDYKNTYKHITDYLDYDNKIDDGLRSIDRVDVIPKEVYDNNKGTIEEAEEILKRKKSYDSEYIEAFNTVMSFTVSVSKYKANNKGKVKYVKMKNLTIPIISNCTYSTERGIIITKDEKRKSDIEYIDNII